MARGGRSPPEMARGGDAELGKMAQSGGAEFAMGARDNFGGAPFE
jgi:hypothetical protein